MLSINLARPICLATLVVASKDGSRIASDGDVRGAAPESQVTELGQLNSALAQAVDKLNEFCDRVFASHKEGIAKLSVEIAAKVLSRKVDEGDYEIENIIQEALVNAPVRQDVVVHLNPLDLRRLREMPDDVVSDIAGVEFVGDPAVGRAECILETPKGIVESVISRHLEEVSRALVKVV